jgi:hypothetical protein
MMHQAAQVVTAVVDITNASWEASSGKTAATMIESEEESSEQLLQAVSPDLSAHSQQEQKLPALKLNDADDAPPSVVHVRTTTAAPAMHRTQHYADLESLSDGEEESSSLAGCSSASNIVDYVIGEVDQSLFKLALPNKKRFSTSARNHSGGGLPPLKKRRFATW